MYLAAAVIAIVTQNESALRASASLSSPKNAVLWQGEAVEVRGARGGYLQVYDYQRERGGYLLEGQVRQYPLGAVDSSSLLEVVRFLRDVRGNEALGIGHAALYLKLASRQEIGAEIFDAIGQMAERLALRASASKATSADGSLAGHLEVARGYGLRFDTVEDERGTRSCYDGDAFREVLRLAVDERQADVAAWRARAALGLTIPGCERGTVSERQALHERAAALLDRLSVDGLPGLLRDRVRLRRVAIWSTLAFERARAGQTADAQVAAQKAMDELGLVVRAELAEVDTAAYGEAAVRAAVARAAVEVGAAPTPRLGVTITPQASGETCVALSGPGTAARQVVIQRCTYGQVWPGSVRVGPKGDVATVAVQPLATWRELWVFHRTAGEWVVDVVAPSTEPSLGYVEWAGFSPDGSRLLLAREARQGGRLGRSFEVLRLDDMAVERKAERPGDLTSFHRWQSPAWRRQTLALR